MRRPLALLLRVVVWGLLLLLVLGLFAAQQAQRWIQQQGIHDLGFSGVRWQAGSLHIGRLSLTRLEGGGYQQLIIGQLQLQPDWSAGQLQHIAAEHLWLSMQPGSQPVTSPAANPFDWPFAVLQDSRQWLARLPEQLVVEQLTMDLPCGEQYCHLRGHFNLTTDPEQMQLALQLHHAGEQLRWQSDLELREHTRLNSTIELNTRPLAQVDLTGSDGGRQWHASLLVPDWPDSSGLLNALSPWLNRDGWPVDQLPQGARFNASGFWRGDQPPENPGQMLQGELAMQADLSLPEPWLLPGYARIQGDAQIGLAHFDQAWQISRLQTDLNLDQLQHPALADVPDWLRPEHLQLQLRAREDQTLNWQQTLSAELSLSSQGSSQIDWNSQLELGLEPALQLTFKQGELDVRLAALQLDDWALGNVHVQAAALAGQVNAQQIQLLPSEAITLRLQQLENPALDLAANNLQLTLADNQLLWPLTESAKPKVSSRISLQAGTLEHPLLKAQGWNGQWQLDWHSNALTAQGQLGNAGGLNMSSQLQLSDAGDWKGAVELEEIFFRAGNPLAASLADWPALLSLSSGRLTGNVSLLGSSGLDSLEGQLQLRGANGIYDRSSFSGLDLPLQIDLRGEQLQLESSGLRITSIDPGLPLGPVQLSASYLADMDSLLQGQVRIEQAELQGLGGRVWLEPDNIDLATSEQVLPFRFSGLELGRLLEVYPTEGLEGGGTLDGQLPLKLSDGAFSVSDGLVQARNPGGRLQYRSERISELAAGNPGMRELAVALDDFRYTLLRSTLDYQEDGTLLLGLRLEGSNPALQQGRPVHLNIQLEEDIPALLASLQLSGQVSEIIQKRVQQRLLQRQNP
ncbi:intermembrane phospholipid transport protein YdbH family protein [Halopseudomonas salegens]|uniref:Dicarboxylate transport n=1 Tax=Halopseudomonas salegens TaxID=1434072 RepID=A0A1H2HGV9_9GAMM|nr:YdbH domain-containing protein [Halopseudomonas salegens]SDU31073.1 Dicarboxylate transport [Halopseudomonas salegens]